MELINVALESPQVPTGAWLCPEDDPYPKGAPLITSVPDDDSPLAYNEDEMVFLWTQIYRIFLKIGYLRDEGVVFPPEDTGRHTAMDRARFQTEFNMSDRVISLIERLPYPAEGAEGMDGTAFFPEGMILNYLNQDENVIDACRDPHPMFWYQRPTEGDPAEQGPARDYLLPDDVALLSPYESDGMTWILDTKTNAIRTFWGVVDYTSRTIPDDFEDERPDDEDHYRNWPAYHAPFILKQYIRDLWNLKYVPERPGESILDSETTVRAALIAHVLRKDYGWPDAFRAEAWKEDSRKIMDAAFEMEEALVQRGYYHGLEIIKHWKKNPDQIPDIGTVTTGFNAEL
ncbi:hypothetical protein ACRALDRAFT_1082093 [Sodiomyces alcalophilus JCM 7366]|uniref:uncharacterized protein n=1 Tax=Sodiomyces alcalophilus JCM 7366 TaxID=591952 RepID=UPI0039B46467